MFQDNISNLFDLVWFSFSVLWLKVEDLLNTLHGKYVVIASDALIKPKPPEKTTGIVLTGLYISIARNGLAVNRS